MPYTRYLSEWSAKDRAIVVAVLLEKAERCDMCGSAAWQWEEDPDYWRAVDEVCQGCAHRDLLRESHDADRKAGDTRQVPGTRIRLVRGAVAIAREQARVAGQKASRPKSRREIAAEKGA